jgi:hypothetical protein
MVVDPENQRAGHVSGWSTDEDPEGGFRWTAFGPAGTVQGEAPTRAEGERAAMQAEQDLLEESDRARLDRSAGDAPPTRGRSPAERVSGERARAVVPAQAGSHQITGGDDGRH